MNDETNHTFRQFDEVVEGIDINSWLAWPKITTSYDMGQVLSLAYSSERNENE